MQTIRGATRNLDRIGYAQWLLRRLSRAQIRLQAAMGRRYASRNRTR